MSYVDVKGKATSKKTVVYIWISLALSRNFHARTETVRPLRGAVLQERIQWAGARAVGRPLNAYASWRRPSYSAVMLFSVCLLGLFFSDFFLFWCIFLIKSKTLFTCGPVKVISTVTM